MYADVALFPGPAQLSVTCSMENCWKAGRGLRTRLCRCITAQFMSLLVIPQTMKLLQKASDARDVRKVCACMSLHALHIVYMFQSHSQTVLVLEWGWCHSCNIVLAYTSMQVLCVLMLHSLSSALILHSLSSAFCNISHWSAS